MLYAHVKSLGTVAKLRLLDARSCEHIRKLEVRVELRHLALDGYVSDDHEQLVYVEDEVFGLHPFNAMPKFIDRFDHHPVTLSNHAHLVDGLFELWQLLKVAND